MSDSASPGHMPRLRMAVEEFAIYDDFLAPEQFAALARYANAANYRQVHATGVRKVWRLHDGAPLQGDTTYLSAASPADGRSSEETADQPLDAFLRRLDSVVDAHPDLVGARCTRWTKVSAAPWIYPVGTGLSLHNDGRYSGSYTFFLHPRWGLHWGGYLMIFNPFKYCGEVTVANLRGPQFPWLSFEAEDSEFEEPGVAAAVFAKPNRLVLIAPDAHHMVTRVDANAGQHARISVAGFFHVG